ncbi:MAG: phosphotransferase [Desulfobacteraceae bacterium]|nr:phosphotransferase [Desulfobacteraceae bacterium]
MKALILSAGFGTRLLPYTKSLAKPLFTLSGKPILQLAIERLIDCGCKKILINTHHLHGQIETFVKSNQFCADISTIHEPEILETGGAIANAKFHLKDDHFFVVNSDVVCNADLKRLYLYHKKGDQIATLLLHDHEQFNKLRVDDNGYIKSFCDEKGSLAFTGIQVLSPEIFDYFPDKKAFSSIEVYEHLCPLKKVKAYIGNDIFWADIGTPEAYTKTALVLCALTAAKMPIEKASKITMEKLAGDGSDRKWYRAIDREKSWVIADHGICLSKTERYQQKNAFIHIGNHLVSKNIPVPEIICHDPISGMVALEDLGDLHLEAAVKKCRTDHEIIDLYQNVCDQLIRFSSLGFENFNPEWTCQTQSYSKKMILKYECRYFMEAFINNYLNKEIFFSDLEHEFEFIADKALENAHLGLMHRDMQSRNIMLKDSDIFFIDFQSARKGPLQYDLASLFIDPYVQLNNHIRQALLKYVIQKLGLSDFKKEKGFEKCYT